MGTSHRERLRTIGRRLQWVVRGLLGVTALSVGWLLLIRGPLGLLRPPASVALRAHGLSTGGAALAIALGLLVPACYVIGLLAMDRLFGLYAQGEVFTARPLAAVRLVGYALLAVDPAKVLVSALTGPLLTWLGVTEPFVSIDLEVSMLIAGLFVVAIGTVLELGQALDETDRLTI
jgi:hypothetical protein